MHCGRTLASIGSVLRGGLHFLGHRTVAQDTAHAVSLSTPFFTSQSWHPKPNTGD